MGMIRALVDTRVGRGAASLPPLRLSSGSRTKAWEDIARPYPRALFDLFSPVPRRLLSQFATTVPTFLRNLQRLRRRLLILSIRHQTRWLISNAIGRPWTRCICLRACSHFPKATVIWPSTTRLRLMLRRPSTPLRACSRLPATSPVPLTPANLWSPSTTHAVQPTVFDASIVPGFHWSPSTAQGAQPTVFNAGMGLPGHDWSPSTADVGQPVFTGSNLVDFELPGMGPVWSFVAPDVISSGFGTSAAPEINGGAFNYALDLDLDTSPFGIANLAKANPASNTGAPRASPKTALGSLAPLVRTGGTGSSQLHQPFRVESGCAGTG